MTSVLFSRSVCSHIKTNGLFQHQTRTTEWFDFFFLKALCQSLISKEHMIELVKQNVLVYLT